MLYGSFNNTIFTDIKMPPLKSSDYRLTWDLWAQTCRKLLEIIDQKPRKSYNDKTNHVTVIKRKNKQIHKFRLIFAYVKPNEAQYALFFPMRRRSNRKPR